MEIGENAIYEHGDGSLEIVGPTGHTIFIRPEHRHKLASAIGTQRPTIKCMFCGDPIPFGFECNKCHEKIENNQKHVWTIYKNGEVLYSKKTSKNSAFQAFNRVAKDNNATLWDWEENCYRDEKGNWFALRITPPTPLEPAQYIVPRIFDNANH